MQHPARESELAVPTCPSRVRAGFTLLELLVVTAIITILVALLFPAVRGTIATARGFRCQSSLRTIALDFNVFADDDLHGYRGSGDQKSFTMEAFQDSQYSINDFWDTTQFGSTTTRTIPDTNGRDPMRCAEVRGPLTLSRFVPCSQGGVTPAQNVSYGANARLQWSESLIAQGGNGVVRLRGRVLQNNSVPLLMDVDGAKAAPGVSPTFVAPSLHGGSLFANSRYWYPARRHNGTMNVVFMDSHVESTKAPLDESGWAWDFDPSH